MDSKLLDNLKEKLPKLEELLEEMSSHWFYEDPIYRFYYQSYKVYFLQEETKRIVEVLKSIAPEGQTFCKKFQEIIDSGASGKTFEPEHNENWTSHTRVFVEAFFHAKFFLEMAVKYGKELKKAPSPLPSGWAALLCLYDIR
ncbi:MAG: hypothetical protein KKI12_00155 [Proteobacteria bacterium]|nr:hypothetical protein [Pseudomonadota bacterium]MCG2757359.1 hypothetical protein [Desulfobacteraceae bacterium]